MNEAGLISLLGERIGSGGFIIGQPVRREGCADSGELHSRASASAGSVLMVTPDHQIGTGDVLTLSWGEGQRSATVSSVDGETVGVIEGAGDDLPAQGTRLHVIRRARLMEVTTDTGLTRERRRYRVVAACVGADADTADGIAQDPAIEYYVIDKGGIGETAWFKDAAWSNKWARAPVPTDTSLMNLGRLFASPAIRRHRDKGCERRPCLP
jgi:hypothetical protein